MHWNHDSPLLQCWSWPTSEKLRQSTSHPCFHFIWVGSAGWIRLSRLRSVFSHSPQEHFQLQLLLLSPLNNFVVFLHWVSSSGCLQRLTIDLLAPTLRAEALFPSWIDRSIAFNSKAVICISSCLFHDEDLLTAHKMIKVHLKLASSSHHLFPSVPLLQFLLERPLCVWKIQSFLEGIVLFYTKWIGQRYSQGPFVNKSLRNVLIKSAHWRVGLPPTRRETAGKNRKKKKIQFLL